MTILRKWLIITLFPLLVVGVGFANVTVSLSDVEVDGYTSDIVVPVTVTNPDDAVGGFQFDVVALPILVELSGVTAVDDENFNADYTVFDDGSGRVVFYSNNSGSIAAGGDAIVLNLHFDGSEILSALLNLEMYDLAVSDADGGIITSTTGDGSIVIGDVVFLSAGTDTGDVSENVSIDIDLENSGLVGGLQFDIYDTPDFLDITSFTTTDRSAGFSVEYNDLDNGATRVIMYDPENGNIEAGDGAILTLGMTVHDDAYNSNVGINFDLVTITDDIGGTYWVGGADSGTVVVSPGYIEEPHNLVAEDGMDEEVSLSWDPPIGPIFSYPASIVVITDNWGYETTWQIVDDATGDVVESYMDAALDNNTEYSWDMELLFGSYTFTIYDSYGDGIYSPGGYAIYVDEEEMFSNLGTGWNGTEESVQFDVSAGRFSVTNTSFIENLPENKNISMTDFSQLNLTLGEPSFVASGSFTPMTPPTETQRNTRPVELDAYKIYRSYNSTTDFDEIGEVNGTTTSYLDDEVVNSTTYYYYVTAIYPDGSESGATNTVSATPVEWVELWMDNGSSLTGQMDTLDFYINNETQLGLFYFEIMDDPNVINSINVIPTDRTADWSVEISDQGNGTIAITGISLGTPLASGDGAVCRAILYPDADESMMVNLNYSNATSIQDVNYVNLNWTAENGSYDVGIETQYNMLMGGYGEDGGSFTTSYLFENTQPVYGIQLDIVANPPYLTGTNVTVGSAHDFSNWDISGTVIGNIYRVIMVNNSHNAPINPGISHIADITFEIPAGIPDASEVIIDVSDSEITDINDLPMHTESVPADVYIGLPPAAYTIQNVSGNLSPGGSGTFQVHLDNTETVGTLQFTIVDLPSSMMVTNVTPVGRFDDGIVDGSSEEMEDGTYYFLGYDFSSGIEAGSGPILEIEVEFDNNLTNSSIIMSMINFAAGDAGANPLTTVFHGFAQFTGYLALDGDVSLPGEFALHQNYPNPFNPSTVITYDLATDSNVRLDIFDIMGRNVKTLVNEKQIGGRHIVSWDANDQFGQAVSAGVYLTRLHTGNKVFTQKMILMK
ncbi:MAG: T9SS type A sorting domain-containing protein [Candidatus Marinimicrobia bacterium]|nr:T9SS type A sorting domain-containing protein [Candidatus Neomarinimicrobiota bacterium]MBT6413590.1 T9SS type A sorting domain-containing protein [Candidatus Neomarinimicrobiota bacterium]MBT7514588.1 T9SS type A sorting domain-containing protein [Candidatus Neomarinimicrobiota bacterium]